MIRFMMFGPTAETRTSTSRISAVRQFHAPAPLANGKYSPVSLAVERWLSGSLEAVWSISGRN